MTETHILQKFGWDTYLSKSATASLDVSKFTDTALIARVVVENRTNVSLQTESGIIPGILRGNFHKKAKTPGDFPKVGDWVKTEKIPGEKKVVVTEILPRYSQVARKAAGDSPLPQIIATNVDYMLIVHGLDQELNLPLLHRYISMAERGNVTPIIVMNKSDVEHDDTIPNTLQGKYPNLSIYSISALTSKGIDPLHKFMTKGVTIALVGPSGAGKSTLINAILQEDIQKTGEVRLTDAKGRHTTTKRETFTLPDGGILIDTPGIRELELIGDTKTTTSAFSVLEELAFQCKFRNCDHNKSAGCAIISAVESGDVTEKEYTSFLKSF